MQDVQTEINTMQGWQAFNSYSILVPETWRLTEQMVVPQLLRASIQTLSGKCTSSSNMDMLIKL